MKPKAKIAPKSRVIFNPLRQVVIDPCCASALYKTRTGAYAHQCYDNSELLIDENDPEFESCTCGKPNPKT